MFEEKLKEELKDDIKLKLLSAVYKQSADSLCIVLQYPNDVVLSASQKENIRAACKKIASVGCSNVSVQLKKAFVDADYAASRAKAYLNASYPLVAVFACKSLKVTASGQDISISFTVESGLAEYVKDKKVKETLEERLSAELCVPVAVSISYEEIDEPEDAYQEPVYEEAPTEFTPRFIKVFDKQAFVGEEIQEKPIYISDKYPSERLCVCGVITYYQLKEYTTKSGKTKHIARLGLKDPTGELSAIMFVSEANLPKMQKLVPNTEVLVSGKCAESDFTGGLELEIKDIMLCQIEKNFVEVFNFKPEPKEYKSTFPEKIEHREQISLFQPERKVNEYLQNNDIVVFDLETTGLNFMDSEIIEIGAIKIKKGGIISERFACFVKPKNKIPHEITQLTGITNQDVAGGVSLSDAMADFYKFTRGATLVGHNVSFDYGFVAYYGKKEGYDFSTNKTHDTYALSTKYVKGLKNYKLKTVADHFNISLKDAHRAYNDAYATAEVYLKLCEFM